MAVINLTTLFNADIETCFNMARDIDAHTLSATHTKEKAIAGKTTGLCEAGDTITWEATHFGIRQYLTVHITQMNPPHSFEDTMLKGAFKSMRHLHTFKHENGKTIMTDTFSYEVPFGMIGGMFDMIILRRYMTRFLETRNRILKQLIEGYHT